MSNTPNVAAILSMNAAPPKPEPLVLAGYEVASLTHIENLQPNEGYDEVRPAFLTVDFQGELGLGEKISVKSFRHTHRPSRGYGYGYHRPESADQVRGQPLLFLLAYNSHDEKEIFPSAIAAKKMVSIRFVQSESSYNSHDWQNYFRRPNCVVEFEICGKVIPICTSFSIIEKLTLCKINRNLTVLVDGRELKTNLDAFRGASLDPNGFGRHQSSFDFTFTTLSLLESKADVHNHNSLANLVWGLYVGANGIPNFKPARLDGVAKTYSATSVIHDSLFQTHPFHYIAYRTWLSNCHRSVDGIRHSVIFNAAMAGVVNKEQMVAVLEPLVQNRDLDQSVKEMPIYRTKRKEHLKSTTNRAFHKLMADFDFLNLDKTQFPRLNAAIECGDVPVKVFFRKEEQYFIQNGNFPLWEEMLKKHYDATVELAKATAARQRFEKDLMSYFYFIFYALPEYLKKHTKKKWTCYPKLVDSMTELDAPAGDESGIARQRSALTPLVDNEKCTVVVPYAALRISGEKIQWCYSHDYHVLQRGLSINGNVVTSDLEEKLNGKDDYGLMFYTLVGSETAQGYPTFLIIFEKRNAGVHVHFHRTHPSRSKDGDYNPVHDWIKVCYNWMAGNVLRSKLKYQQGDLLFIPMEESAVKKIEEIGIGEGGFAPGNVYDNHWFEEPVLIAPSTVKSKSSNVLGYVKLGKDIRLMHKEHDPVPMAAGAYEIRQCRSWEANPKGIWTLRID